MYSPLISIIVPCYNVEKYLPKCIESIINQTYKNIEIILVDDGSTDNTLKVCYKWAHKDKRIKVIHKENGGLVSARNAGYNVITGEWHMYIDSDDWIDTCTCEKIVKAINLYKDVDIIFWKCIQELPDKSIKGKWEWPCNDKMHLYQDKECIELAHNTLIYKSGIATAYCKLIRSDYARKFGIYHDYRLRQGAEGVEFSLRAFYYAKKALYLNAYYNHYRFNPNSISKKIDEKNTMYLSDCFEVIQEDIKTFENNESFREALYQRVIYVLIAIAMSTYFHPSNKDSLINKIKKYQEVINNNSLFKISLKNCNTNGMDKQRKLTLFFIRNKMYFMLHFISKAKQFLLKRGYFKY
ncbi:glycosyltransferase family 2 protein [Phocaeicola plebeius]|uniref:glycosyltransferase family 2 protein n=1 Tax=Phocaeicola plebeius TaxID=310297 RepID=UPI00307D7E8E